MKPKILLINPRSVDLVYINTNVKAGKPSNPVITLAAVAAPLLSVGYSVKIFDMELIENDFKKLTVILNEYKPDYVGITSNTPQFKRSLKIAELIKNMLPDTKIVMGGVHPTVLPEEPLLSGVIDIIVLCEGDFTLKEIIEASNLQNVQGIKYVKNGTVHSTEKRKLIENLDNLPFPAWELYDISQYSGAKIYERNSPGGHIETSRGCPYSCCYCNKSIFGHYFRAKSPEYVVEEIIRMKKMGFREIHIIDDGLGTDINRLAEICDCLIKKEVKIPFTFFSGIRADSCRGNIFEILKKAGCYQVAFGIESGDEEVLKASKKQLKLDDVRTAVNAAKKAGVETFGFFMMGLPGETEKSLKRTIDFACSLNLDIAKFDITIPYPGTAYYNELSSNGFIVSHDWDKYIVHGTEKIYNHPNLSWDALEKYYKMAFKKFYLRPSYMLKRCYYGISNGLLFDDIKNFLSTKWN